MHARSRDYRCTEFRENNCKKNRRSRRINGSSSADLRVKLTESLVGSRETVHGPFPYVESMNSYAIQLQYACNIKPALSSRLLGTDEVMGP